ncbi:hypothetical protein TIFTF001_036048 [Ficus carica]|uniref:Uncharacterized protein n=1 Tax=Ficus carica TaxID=3494 RepID=A0AA88E2P9_FICCA|nr:hypothetical protein TIFTF001_036048 [Ficus carica]
MRGNSQSAANETARLQLRTFQGTAILGRRRMEGGKQLWEAGAQIERLAAAQIIIQECQFLRLNRVDGVFEGCGYMIWIDPPIPKSSYANEELMKRLEIIEDAILRVDGKLDFKDLDILNLKQELVKKEEEIVKIRVKTLLYVPYF